MPALYRHYDRAGLDVQYNARATVPDITPIIKAYADDSRAARQSLPCALNVAYGEHADELLDIFPAATGAAGAPVLFFIHGGYWRPPSQGDSSRLAPPLPRARAVVGGPDYSPARA